MSWRGISEAWVLMKLLNVTAKGINLATDIYQNTKYLLFGEQLHCMFTVVLLGMR